MSEALNPGDITPPAEPKSKLRSLIPLAIFLVLAGFLFRAAFALCPVTSRSIIAAFLRRRASRPRANGFPWDRAKRARPLDLFPGQPASVARDRYRVELSTPRSTPATPPT